MSRSNFLSETRAWFDKGELRTTLERRVAFKTEGDLPELPSALWDYLKREMIPYLDSMGFRSEIFDNPLPKGPPILVSKRIEGAELPTLLIYTHGDVVNGQDARWQEGLNPWTLTTTDGRWYGRGCADNKGQHTITLFGLQKAIEARNNQLGYNVVVLMEMGEEAGSPGLTEFCKSHKELLSADLLIASDGPRINANSPTIFLGSRGLVNFSLTVKPRDKAYHSGNWGGVLVNPATRLIHALSTLVDMNGRLLVDKLYAPPPSALVKDALSSIEIGKDPGDPKIDLKWGQSELTPAERLIASNTLEILALGSGQPDRPVNAIPSQAIAHCQLRFVVGTDWENLLTHIQNHLRQSGFDDVVVNIHAFTPATRLDLNNPWVNWVKSSIENTTNKKVTVLPNLAGSLPNDVFADILGLPTIWVPHSYPACNQHAPNEHMLESVAAEGLQMMAGIFWDLGDKQITKDLAWN
ncbi:M20 family metallopeptidase [Polynucleobacter sp. MWH-UH23A]|uniref:M20 family metallopeptidase n=1 Tax=Polynucleobacter sp. MWH-UH23A TaxID=1855613 RepID=UPI0033650C88